MYFFNECFTCLLIKSKLSCPFLKSVSTLSESVNCLFFSNSNFILFLAYSLNKFDFEMNYIKF